MKTAKQLREKFEKDLIDMQHNCSHPYSDWMEESWAPAHFTGSRVKVCLICDKVLGKVGPKYPQYYDNCDDWEVK